MPYSFVGHRSDTALREWIFEMNFDVDFSFTTCMHFSFDSMPNKERMQSVITSPWGFMKCIAMVLKQKKMYI